MALLKPFERRSSHRTRVELPLDLVLENGSIVPATASNLSASGLQFHCDGWTAHEIDPRGVHKHALDAPPLKVVTRLHQHNIYIRCRIISARRLSQDNYLIGLEFLSFEGDGQRHLETFLDTIPPFR